MIQSSHMANPSRKARRVVLIGWDAADWNLLNPLLDAGSLLHVATLVERGVVGRMATMVPPLSPLLWTSVVTGVKPDRHGILGFVEPDPVTGGVRPVASTSRKVKAIWNILHQQGLRSIVVNWFAGHPAEPINGAVVSDAFPKAVGPYRAEWPVTPGMVHPAALAESLQQLRVHAGDLSGDDLALFIPLLDRIDQSKDSRVAALASVLAENISTHAAVTWLMQNQEWDFCAALYSTIDLASHAFMPFRSPAMEGLSKEDCEIYKDVVDGVCRFQDLLLGRLVQLAGPDAVIILMSDHGVHTDNLRPTKRALFAPETPALQHRSHGILCMAGPGIRQDELIYGAQLVDITPTILTLFGIPSGKDMQGRVLVEAFEEPVEVATIPSWEDVSGDCGRHPAQPLESPWDSANAINQLADLGYIDHPGENAQEFLRLVRHGYDFNLARVYLASRRPADALPLLEKLVDEVPDELAFRLHLAQCYCELGRNEECRATVESVLEKDRNRPAAGLILANLSLAEGRIEEGLEQLLQAEKCSRPAPEIRHLVGRVYLRQHRFEEAARVFRSVLSLDPDHAAATAGLAQSLLQQNEPERAAEAAMDAIRLQFDLPEAHYTLGVALVRTRRITRAIQAFETCLALHPASSDAHRWLATIHEEITKDATKSSWHREMAERCVVGHA